MKLKDVINDVIAKAEFDIKKFLISFIPDKNKRNELFFKIMLKKWDKINPAKKLQCKVGRCTYCGKSVDVQHPNTVIGSFCSIAQETVIGPGNHPIEFLSTSPAFYTGMFGWKNRKSSYKMEAKPCHIGNDVWMGYGVFIKAGVTVGDGAVIGSRAVVVKDVPPYAIVGGVPAKIIRYRFDEKIIKDLLKLKWWDLDDETIQKIPFEHIEEAVAFLKKVRGVD